MENINIKELNSIVRKMQDESIEKHKVANNFNAMGAAIV